MSPETTDELTQLRAQVQALTDRAEITALLDRYAHTLDQRRFDQEWARSLFTDDVELRFPVGDHQGIDGVADSHRQTMGRFDRTQHIHTTYLIDLAGDHAQAAFQLLGTHVYAAPDEAGRGERPGAHFQVGNHYQADLVRTAAGWRVRRLVNEVIWTRGEPPVLTPAPRN
ncbi:MAG TPA: nuclear transport factor 2 family protein [Pseudonocardiaceae bacterium]|jgi:hypothetical protein|nr:nuclear transport factor 2 family protein [Pseudonocardiaceae bacterium]